MNPACILRLWTDREVRIYQPFSREDAESLLRLYERRGWSGAIEERD